MQMQYWMNSWYFLVFWMPAWLRNYTITIHSTGFFKVFVWRFGELQRCPACLVVVHVEIKVIEGIYHSKKMFTWCNDTCICLTQTQKNDLAEMVLGSYRFYREGGHLFVRGTRLPLGGPVSPKAKGGRYFIIVCKGGTRKNWQAAIINRRPPSR